MDEDSAVNLNFNHGKFHVRTLFSASPNFISTGTLTQHDKDLNLELYEGPVFNTIFLIHANLKSLTLPDIVKEAIAGIIKESAKEVPQKEVNQRQAEKLAEKLDAVKHFADHAKDIYDIHREIGKTCILLYTMDTFWYRSINSILWNPRHITYDQFETFAPFCFLLRTYLQHNFTSNIRTVYRGLILTETQIQQYKQADSCFQFTSFTSTSTNREVAEMFGNTLFLIDLNVLNYHRDNIIDVGAYIGPNSNFPDEEEFLIWPLTIFKFVKYDFDQEQKKHLIYLQSSLHPVLTAALGTR